MPQISVVTPARDVQDYIEHLLHDLSAQTWRDFEAIIVDDGSLDDTRSLLDAAAERDPRFRVLETAGEGPSAARNRGMDVAEGDEIAFVDADDRISPRYLEVLHQCLADSGSDMAVANVRRLEGFTTRASGLHLRALANAPGATHLRHSPELVYDTTIWNKLIRRRLWERDRLRFDVGRIINDVYPSLRSHVLAEQVQVIDEVLYYWRVREDPTASITDSKLSDFEARQKSLDDRLFALQRTRRMLAADLPEPSVLLFFDERVLTHDMWVYLPLYHESDDHYRRTLVEGIRAYLQTFDVDPARFHLGPVLTGAYEAILRTHDEALELLLAPDTLVVGATGRRGFTTRAQLASSTRAPRRLTSWRRRLVGRRTKPTFPQAEARITRILLSPESDRLLAITGQIRVRDGRSHVDAPWELAANLLGRPSRARIQGRTASVASDPEPNLHPLQRRGWRAFDATVPLPSDELDEGRWDLLLSLQLGGRELPLEQRLSADAARYLMPSLPIGIDADLTPLVADAGHLSLRRTAAPLRLTGIEPEEADRLVLHLDRNLQTIGVRRLWFEDEDGRVTIDAEFRPGTSAVLILPHGPRQPLERAGLWCEIGGQRRRVRAAPSLITTTLAVATCPSRELVVRPTVRGNVVIETRPPQPRVTWARAVRSRGTVTLGGPTSSAFRRTVHLELRCRWSEDLFSVPIATSEEGWVAEFQPDALLGHSGGAVRSRILSVAFRSQDDMSPLRVPLEIRHRFPLAAGVGACEVELRVGGGGGARLWVSPRIDPAARRQRA